LLTEWNEIQAEMIAGLLMKKKTDSPNSPNIFKAVNRFKNQGPEEQVEEKTDKERASVMAKEARRNFFSSLASMFLGPELVAEFQVAAETTIVKKQGVAARLKERRKMDEAKQVMPEIVRDLEDRIEISIHNRMHYRKFFFGTMWLFFHFAILLNINGTFEKYNVKSSVTKFIDVSSKKGLVNFPSDWYEWFDSKANQLWTDPYCGNGICEVCTCELALSELTTHVRLRRRGFPTCRPLYD
jgi:hypothetical protein